MKSRGVYETPGGAILYKAINVLEPITLDKESSHFKAQLAQKYADLVYNGQWFTPLREALDAVADSLEKTVTCLLYTSTKKNQYTLCAGFSFLFARWKGLEPVSYTHLHLENVRRSMRHTPSG